LGKGTYGKLILSCVVIPILLAPDSHALAKIRKTKSDVSLPSQQSILSAIKQASSPSWLWKEMKNGPMAKGNWYGMLATPTQWYPAPYDMFYDKRFSPSLFKHRAGMVVLQRQPFVVAEYVGYNHADCPSCRNVERLFQYVGYQGSTAFWKKETVDPQTGRVLDVVPYLVTSGSFVGVPSLSSVPVNIRNRGLKIRIPQISTQSMTPVEAMNAESIIKSHGGSYTSDLFWGAGGRVDVVPFPNWNPNWKPQSATTTVKLRHQPNVVALSPNGNLAIVGYTNAKQISIVDLKTQQVLHTVQLPSQAVEIQFTPSGNTAVVTDGNQNVDLVNVQTGGMTSVAISQWITSLNILPGGAYALMTTGGSGSGQVVELSLSNDKIVYQQNLNFSPDSAVLSTSGHTLLMTGKNLTGSSFSTEYFNISKQQVVHTIPVGGQHITTAMNGNVLILDTNANTLWIGSTNPVASFKKIHFHFNVMSVALSQNGHLAVVVRGANSIATATVLNVDQRRIEGTVNVGQGAQSVCITPNGKLAIVGNSEDGSISLVQLGKPFVTSTLNTGGFPFSVSMAPNGSPVVALIQMNNALFAFNLIHTVAVSPANALAAQHLYGGSPFASVVDTYTNPPWIPSGIPYMADEWLTWQ